MKLAAPLVLDGAPMGIADVVAVARGSRPVVLAGAARERLAEQRRLILDMVERGVTVYGLNTGLGALKRVRVDAAEQRRFNRELILSHRIGHGPLAPQAVVRAAMLVRAQDLVHGRAGVRPELVEAYLDTLRETWPAVHVVGSLGVSDLGPLAEIAWELIEAGFEPDAKEGLAMLNANSSRSAGPVLRSSAPEPRYARSNPRPRSRSRASSRTCRCSSRRSRQRVPIPGLRRRSSACASCSTAARCSPMRLRASCRIPHVPGRAAGARRCPRRARARRGPPRDRAPLRRRQSASRLEAGRAYSCGNFEIGMLAAALDYTRIALAQAATIAAERCQKLVNPIHSGLPAGLRESEDVPGDGLNIFVYGASALAVEARLLAQPASAGIPTTTTAEGIEDRMSNAVLCARRLDELAGLCERLAAVELVTAAQAVDARGRRSELGRGTAAAYDLVRAHVAPSRADAPPPQDLDGLCEALPMLP